MLSICICTLTDRARQFAELMECIQPQADGEPVEILVESDSGQATIGEKRNRLLQRAKGQYIAFVDDDDMVAAAYVPQVLSHIRRYFNENNAYPDCVGMCGMIDGGSKD